MKLSLFCISYNLYCDGNLARAQSTLSSPFLCSGSGLGSSEWASAGTAAVSGLDGGACTLEEIFSSLEPRETAVQSQSCSLRVRILVCSPSNAVVDEVVSRILAKGFLDGNLLRYNPDILRVGRQQSIKTEVSYFTNCIWGITFNCDLWSHRWKSQYRCMRVLRKCYNCQVLS